MNQKLQLPNVTLIAVAGNKQPQTIAALYKCMAQVEFAAVKLITNINISCTGIETINVGGLESWEKYNYFLVKELTKYFDTPYVLVVQWDGYVLDAGQWDDEFLGYDYVAAKWLDIGRPFNVGNGGFSLRSKKLHDILATDENIITTCPEDTAICKVYGQYLMDMYDIEFAPESVADKFAFELNEPLHKTLGFHAFHWKPYRETVVIKRNHAMGDVIMVEPVLEYFHKKGYQVAIDTSPDFDQLFIQHHYPVVPRRHLNPNLPVIEYDLNMAYEVKPQRNHLQSYYDFCQVPQEARIIRNPRLNIHYDEKQMKLFKKYAILHIDQRAEAYRNIYGVHWEEVVRHLNSEGYMVIQLGNGEHEEVKGAHQMKTPVIPFLMWVVKASDLFVGIDSGIAHIASGFNIPSVIFFGSVDANIIYPSIANKAIVENHDVCEQPKCWHHSISQNGTKCYVDNEQPPCTQFTTTQAINAINETINGQNTVNKTGDNKRSKQSIKVI